MKDKTKADIADYFSVCTASLWAALRGIYGRMTGSGQRIESPCHVVIIWLIAERFRKII